MISKLLNNKNTSYRSLKEIAIMKRGTSVTQKTVNPGKIPVVSGGQKPAYYCDKSNREGEVITVAGSGAYAGYVQYWNEPIFVCDAFSIQGINEVMTKYLFYVLKNMQNDIYSTHKEGGVPHVHISSIENFQIPVPPLPVQEEIVRILDKFTELKAELDAELDARKKQYTFYRDQLLNFDDGYKNIKYCKIKDVFTRLKGTSITAEKMKEIENEDGEIRVFAGGKTMINAFECDIPNANITNVPAVLVQSRGVIDVIYYDKPFTFKNEMWAYTADDPITVKYLYHILKNNIHRFRALAAEKGSMPQISLPVTEDFVIALPSLEIQQRIVDVLDNFDAICSDLSIGLPAEIAAREKQYEYYRDLLFDYAANGLDLSRAEQSRAEQSRAEQSRAEQSRAEQSRVNEIKLIQYVFGVVFINLNELFDTRNGYTPSKNVSEFWEYGTIPWFRLEDIRENGNVLSDAIQKVSASAIKGKPFPANSIIVSTSATVGEHALITCESLGNQRFTYLILKEQYKELFDIKFLYYYCFKLDEYCLKHLNQGNFASVDMNKFYQFKFPVVPLEKQYQIVKLLEQFDTICNDLKSGLPAEIKKQSLRYEYFRDKLLTFD